MKILLITTLLLLAITDADYEGPYSWDFYTEKKDILSEFRQMDDAQLMQMDCVTIKTIYLYFHMEDTTFQYLNHYFIEFESGGYTYEDDFTKLKGPFDLKLLPHRDSLRADPILRPTMDRLGQFTFNQFTNFQD